jgi:hypothetical protein
MAEWKVLGAVFYCLVSLALSNIYTKLGVKSRTQAVSIGKELKIFE